MALADDFEAATGRSRSLPNQGPENLLKMYGLFKQGKVGDVTGKRPGVFDLKGRAKYDAWAALKGTSKDDAMKQYIELVDKLAG